MAFGWIYEQIINARNALYDRSVFDSFDLGARTISIGNLTTGGTGKTPLVAYAAEILAARGERVCILTRGYGRENARSRVLVSDGENILASPREAGDEPFELAQKLLKQAIVIADADRVAAGEWAKRKFDITTFILDDGFQHRKVRRDVDIVCIDATDPFGGGKMLPAGGLREPLANLKRADVVVITRADLGDKISNLRSQISDLNDEAALFEGKNQIEKVIALNNFTSTHEGGVQHQDTKDEHSNKPAFAFCGIGNPESFFEQLRRSGFRVTGSETFRDHHIYTLSDIANIEKRAHQNGAEMLLTTAKDAVKLSDLKFEMPCFVVEIKTVIDDVAAFAAKL
jgi:tetraacyldisaccharide 4'-kinase